jgi:hypothetical protein
VIDDDERASDDASDDEYQVDPDAAPTAEGRVEQARGELRKLLRSAAAATAIFGAAVVVIELVRGGSYDTSTGYFVGAAIATVNLMLLARGWFAVMLGRAMSAGAVLAFMASFFVLVGVAAFVVVAHREWVLGFALGLTTPALAGILYARTLKDR